MKFNHTEKTYEKMKACINQNKMIRPAETIIVCVSGGCDSVALLLLLKKYSEEEHHKNKIICAHFDHMLRSEESDGDREFVQKLCEELNIEFHYERQDASAYAKETGISLEEGARDIRYQYFNKLAEDMNAKIAIAHNKNDRIETVLQNISRGTGIHGLKGISYTRDHIIRPLLDIERKELEKICEEANVAYRTDSTNTEAFCGRNNIRLNILPYLRQNLTADIDHKIYRLSLLAAKDDVFLEKLAENYYNELVIMDEDKLIINEPEKFSILDEAIKSRVVIDILENYFPGGSGINTKMIERLSYLIDQHLVGTKTEVSEKIIARVYHDGIIIEEKSKNRLGGENMGKTIKMECRYYTPNDAWKITMKEGRQAVAFDKERFDEFCDYNGHKWEIRYRQEGDHFIPFKSIGGKSLKKYFIDRKIPAHIRDHIPLLVCGNEVLWICGVMKSNIAVLNSSTKNAVVFKCVL